MPQFSQRSLRMLDTCDKRLQRLFLHVVTRVDCRVECGFRSETEQEAAFAAGTSKVRFPNSRHNTLPSRAVDVIPYPVEWPDAGMSREAYARALGRWYMFVGYVRAAADELGMKIRCGADWNGDFQVKDQNFHDLPHFELVDE